MKIKNLTIKDAKDAAVLLHALHKNGLLRFGYSKDKIKGWLYKYKGIGVFDGKRLVGVLIYTIGERPLIYMFNKRFNEPFPEGDVVVVILLGVDIDYQSKGIGTMLMKHLLSKFKHLPVVLTSNRKSLVRFYKKLGFDLLDADSNIGTPMIRRVRGTNEKSNLPKRNSKGL